MILPSGIIVIWPSTNASIPAGFTCVTALDGNYAKGAHDTSSQNVSGGSATHSHTSSAHSHALNDHQHTYTTDTVGNGSGQTQGGGHDYQAMDGSHYHTGTTGSISGGGLSSVTSAYDSVANDPPFTSVIFIESQGAAAPTGIIALFANASIPIGWNFCDGTNSTPDLRNQYLKGATTNGDGGATGGLYTNIHPLVHTHSASSHSHASDTTSTPAGSWVRRDSNPGSNTDMINYTHTHTNTVASATQNIAAGNPTVTTAETVEPLYKKLLAVQKSTTPDAGSKGLIGLWLGSAASIPAGWVVCDGTNGTPDMRDYHVKIAHDTSEIGNTGGSNTHTHASQAHSHSSSGSHVHSVTSPTISNEQEVGSGYHVIPSHGHSFNTDPVTATYASANTTADSASNEPPFLTTLFIQLNSIAGGGALIGIL